MRIRPDQSCCADRMVSGILTHLLLDLDHLPACSKRGSLKWLASCHVGFVVGMRVWGPQDGQSVVCPRKKGRPVGGALNSSKIASYCRPTRWSRGGRTLRAHGE